MKKTPAHTFKETNLTIFAWNIFFNIDFWISTYRKTCQDKKHNLNLIVTPHMHECTQKSLLNMTTWAGDNKLKLSS